MAKGAVVFRRPKPLSCPITLLCDPNRRFRFTPHASLKSWRNPDGHLPPSAPSTPAPPDDAFPGYTLCENPSSACGRRSNGSAIPNCANKVTETWIKAFERSPLKPDDLNRIPFTLLVPNCPITFMEHKRCVVHIARESAEAMNEFMGARFADRRSTR